MYFDGNTASIVPYTDEVFILLDIYFDHVHPSVTDEVVRCVDKNLV